MINPQWGFNPIIIRMLFVVTINMVKQSTMWKLRVNTMLEELGLKAFLVNELVGAHNLDYSLDVAYRRLDDMRSRGGDVN
jgi:hypothetical protein